MKTNSNNICPQCGAPLPPDAPAGLCPACVMAMNLATPTIINEDGSTERVKFEAPKLEEIIPLFQQLEIIELLGQGGMGVVYKARQKELDRFVALKILPKEIGNTAGFAERFAREARVLGKLNHPNIVTLHEFGHVELEDGEPLYYFLMEYVDGLNLRRLLNNGRVEAREALSIVPQICDALQYAHDEGIVHRDIKPENILLDRRGNVKVADFGLAKIIEGRDVAEVRDLGDPASRKPATDLTEAGKVMGTPKYMSPEQVEAPGAVDHRADIYALGVVFYQMLTGEMPDQQLQAPSTKVKIDVRLDEVVLRALEEKPDLRYQQASVLKTEVETIVESGGREQESGTREQRAVELNKFPLLSLVVSELFVVGYLLPLLCGFLRISIDPGKLEILLLCGVLGFLNFYVLKKTSNDARRLLLKTAGSIMIFGWLVCGIVSIIFFKAMLEETGGWNPAPSEAYFVILSLVGTVLLPFCAGRLFRALRPSIKQAGKTPVIPASAKFAIAFVAIGIAGFSLVKISIDKPAIRISFTNKGSERVNVNFPKVGTVTTLPLNEASYVSGITEFRIRDARIEIKRRIIVTNTGTNDLVVAYADGGEETGRTILGENGTGYFSKTRPILIGDVVMNIENPAQDESTQLQQLARKPQQLRKLPVETVIEAGMTDISLPWAWQELERRARSDRLNAEPVAMLVDSFVDKMERDCPTGYQSPLFSLGGLFEALSEKDLLPEDDKMRILTGLRGAPALKALSRVVAGEKTFEVEVRWTTPWDDDLFGYAFLNDLKSIRVNGQTVELKQNSPPHQRTSDHSFSVVLPQLEAGIHRLECDIESALVTKASTAGLDHQVSAVDWPPAVKRWTRTCEGEFRIYSTTEKLVELVDDPRRTPTEENGVRIKSVTINSAKQGSAATATVNFNAAADSSIPVSADVFLTLEDQTYRCGRLMLYKFEDRVHSSGLQLTVPVSIPSASLKTAGITLRPNPDYLERKPYIDEIWNGEIIFNDVMLNRYDLHSAEPSLSAISFSDSQEITITRRNADARGFVFFGFAERKIMAPPFRIEHDPSNFHFAKLTEEQWDWIRANKFDILFHFGDTNYETMNLEAQEDYIAQSMEWDTVVPEMVSGVFERKDAKGLVRSKIPASTCSNDYRDGLNTVTAFRTREDLMGAYQVRKINDDHHLERGVSIRYRTLYSGATEKSILKISPSTSLALPGNAVNTEEAVAGLDVPVATENQLSVRIVLSAAGTLTVDAEPCLQEELSDKLKNLPDAPARLIIIVADKTTPHKKMIELMDACAAAGITQIKFAVADESGEAVRIDDQEHSVSVLRSSAASFESEKVVELLVERVKDSDHAVLLDLDSGKTLSTSEGLLAHSQEEGMEWMAEEGFDLMVSEHSGWRGTSSDPTNEVKFLQITTPDKNELKLYRIPAEQRPGITSDELLHLVSGGGPEMESQTSDSGRSYYLGEPLPADFALAFRTADGAMGLLRLDGCSGNPRRLKMRYQRLRTQEPVEARDSYSYSDAEYIVSAEPAPDRIGDKETLRVFNLDASHMSGWKVQGDKLKNLLKTALMRGGDIYYYFDERNGGGRAVFLRQESWSRTGQTTNADIPVVELKDLPLELSVATIDGREYQVRFSAPEEPRTGTMVGILNGNPADLRRQCLVRTVCTNDGSFTLHPFEGDEFIAITDQILTSSNHRVFAGIFCAIYNGVDTIAVYCHYDDPVSRYAFGDKELARSLTLERVEDGRWQIIDGCIGYTSSVASAGYIHSMTKKTGYTVKRFE